MERIAENVQQRLMESVDELDRALDGGDAHDLLDAADHARGSILAAIDLIKSIPTGALDYIKWLENELDKRVPRWISVEERLPEQNRVVLVALRLGGKKTVRIGAMAQICGWWDECGLVSNASVTHWMPLPEPPEEGEDATQD